LHAPQEFSPFSYAAAMAFTHAGRKQPTVNTAANLFKIMAYNNKDLGGEGETNAWICMACSYNTSK